MKISNLLNITGGKLLNEPYIHSVESATVYPSKVESGDLFFAEREEDIPIAISRGAYAIVFEGDSKPSLDSEDEIAWIGVESVKDAAFKLLRYVLIHKESEFYLFDKHEISFLKMIVTHKGNITFLPSDWKRAFETVLNGENDLFVSDDKELLETIVAEPKEFDEYANGYIISDTLFRTTFKIDSYIYQEREMAPFHLDYLKRVTAFAKKYQLPYSLERVKYTKHFIPIFVDNYLHQCSRGSSEKALIFTDNIEDIVSAREYIKDNGRWLKSIVLTPPKTKIDMVDRPFWFEDTKEAVDILKKSHYNYAFIYSLDKNLLKEVDSDYRLF